MVQNFIKSIILLSIGVVLFSCENNIDTIKKITADDTISGITAYDIEYVRTDSGRLQVTLKAPVMIKYDGKEEYTEFPKGFTVYMYGKNETKKAFIRANYGINYTKKNI